MPDQVPVPPKVWAAIERTCHEIEVGPVSGVMYRGDGPRPVAAQCRCGWRGPMRPPEKAETWARRDGEDHIAEVERRLAPSDAADVSWTTANPANWERNDQ